MDKAIKAKWVRALESGKFKQGRKRLARGGYYCCLGVLRKIDNPSVGNDAEILPKEYQDELGLTVEIQQQLASMNDDGKTFKEIASWIRKHL